MGVRPDDLGAPEHGRQHPLGDPTRRTFLSGPVTLKFAGQSAREILAGRPEDRLRRFRGAHKLPERYVPGPSLFDEAVMRLSGKKETDVSSIFTHVEVLQIPG